MNGPVIERLARYLSATETRSGEAIGHELGCSRAAVWKHVGSLRQLGIEIDAVAGQGYRLRQPLELLDKSAILSLVGEETRLEILRLEIEASLDSTNAALQRLPQDLQHAAVILAEHQQSGRGRRGRSWHSPFGRNLYLSLGWKFERSLAELGCLSLVVALAVARALSAAGLQGHRVKWPNDLLVDGRKLCGCLVEVQGDTQGPGFAVVGVGLNVHMPSSESTRAIDQPWTDLQSLVPGCSRNEAAALLLKELFAHLALFGAQGFEPFRDYWREMDGLDGRVVEVTAGDRLVKGTARGVDERGALVLDTGREILRMYAGEVSLRQAGQNQRD